MNVGREMFIPEENERLDVVLETGAAQNMAQLEQCGEMNPAGQMTPLEMEALEQKEMDEFSENGKLGDYKIIHYPPEKESPSLERREELSRLGEYRIFCDTRPGGSRYDIFADGKGK